MMSSYDVFLSFRGNDCRSSFTRTLYAAFPLFHDHDGHGQCKDVTAEDHLPSFRTLLFKYIEESKFSISVFSTRYASSIWCLDELVNIVNLQKRHQWRKSRDSIKEFSLTSTKQGLGYVKNGSVKVQTWKEEAAALANFVARGKTTVVPRSDLFCSYIVDCVWSNLQEQKASSWKPEALNLLNSEETVALTFSSKHLQVCNDMYSYASEVLPTRNRRAGESMNVKLYSPDTNYKLSDGSVYKRIDMNTRIVDEAPSDPPDPSRNLGFTMARKRSTSALLMTIFVLSTFLAGVSFSSSTFKEHYLNTKDTTTSRSIVAINSLVFILSLVTDMFLVHEFTYKWELQIILFALFGAHICLMKATIPQAALPLFMISFPFLLIAAVGDALVN